MCKPPIPRSSTSQFDRNNEEDVWESSRMLVGSLCSIKFEAKLIYRKAHSSDFNTRQYRAAERLKAVAASDTSRV